MLDLSRHLNSKDSKAYDSKCYDKFDILRIKGRNSYPLSLFSSGKESPCKNRRSKSIYSPMSFTTATAAKVQGP